MAPIPPDVAVAEMRAAGAEPLEPYTSAHTPWKAECLSCGKTVAPRLSKIRSGQSPCRACAIKASSAGRRDAHEPIALATLDAAGLDPLEPYPGALKPWRAVCRTCGREVSPRYAQLQQGWSGCGYCSKKKVDPLEAEQFMLEVGVRPKVPYPGTGVPWLCECLACGRAVTPMYGSVKSGQSACKFCARRAVHQEEAIEKLEAAGFAPLEPYPGSRVPWKARCLICGNHVQPRLGYILRGGRGCPHCAGNSPATSEEALAEFTAAGLHPKGPFPGGVETPWPSTCRRCRNEVSPTLKNIRLGVQCGYCAGVKVNPGAGPHAAV